ncbi:MAG: hypothetical protein ACHP9Y_04475 [Gammaproteobacteria bacterium]
MATVHLTGIAQTVQLSESPRIEKLQASLKAIVNNKDLTNYKAVEGAIRIDTKALFVKTPDGVMHVKTDGGYAPNIGPRSFVK